MLRTELAPPRPRLAPAALLDRFILAADQAIDAWEDDHTSMSGAIRRLHAALVDYCAGAALDQGHGLDVVLVAHDPFQPTVYSSRPGLVVLADLPEQSVRALRAEPLAQYPRALIAPTLDTLTALLRESREPDK